MGGGLGNSRPQKGVIWHGAVRPRIPGRLLALPFISFVTWAFSGPQFPLLKQEGRTDDVIISSEAGGSSAPVPLSRAPSVLPRAAAPLSGYQGGEASVPVSAPLCLCCPRGSERRGPCRGRGQRVARGCCGGWGHCPPRESHPHPDALATSAITSLGAVSSPGDGALAWQKLTQE